MLSSLITSIVLSCSPYLPDKLTIVEALDGDPHLITYLRSGGQASLDDVLTVRRQADTSDPRWETLIDKVAGQRFAERSGLFWYTDLDEARAEAARSDRAVLSLRMLGRLDEDLSCANSRFFRTILYPDPAIIATLRKHYVLHWESVREAPVITIDFGHGKKLVRTITGNSLHYIMSPQGEVLDVMPGLVSPATFLAWLEEAAPVATRLGRMADGARKKTIEAYHTKAQERLARAWRKVAKASGLDGYNPAAALSDERLRALSLGNAVTLSQEARALVESMMPTDGAIAGAPAFRPRLAMRAMPVAIGKSAVEQPMLDKLGGVLADLSRDDLKNRFEMRARALALVASIPSEQTLTASIYADLFLTPLDDPWMGLAATDVFTGLPASVERVGATTVGSSTRFSN